MTISIIIPADIDDELIEVVSTQLGYSTGTTGTRAEYVKAKLITYLRTLYKQAKTTEAVATAAAAANDTTGGIH